MKRHQAIALATLFVTTLAAPATANRLTDPGFEDASKFTTDGAPFVGFWEAFTSGSLAASQLSTTMPHTGAQSMELLIDSSANQFAGAFQDVPFSASIAGNEGTFSGWHKSLGDSGGVEIRIEWRDSVNNVEISRTPNFAPTPGADYEQFSLTATSPAGSDTARVVYAIQSFGGALTQQVFVDDLSFTIVPEPVSFGLASLAGLALVAVGRRR